MEAILLLSSDEKKEVPAMPIVQCPWRGGGHIVVDLCKRCQYHQGVKDIVQHRWNEQERRTNPHITGSYVQCHYPRSLKIEALVTGE